MGSAGNLTHEEGPAGAALPGPRRAAAPPAARHAYEFIRHDAALTPIRILSGALALWRSGALALWRSGALALWRSGALALWRYTTP